MRLYLTVTGADSQPRDLVVDCDPSTTVADLSARLTTAVGPASAPGRVHAGPASERGGPPAPPLHLDGEVLDPRLPVSASAIRHGAVIGVGAAVSCADEPSGLVELRITSGPGAGRIHRLGVGSWSIGGGEACGIRLGGPDIPDHALTLDVDAQGAVELVPVPEVAELTVPVPAQRNPPRGPILLPRSDRAPADGELPLTVAPEAEVPVVAIDRMPLLRRGAPGPHSRVRVGEVIIEISRGVPPDLPARDSAEGATRELVRADRTIAPNLRHDFALPAAPASPEGLLPRVMGLPRHRGELRRYEDRRQRTIDEVLQALRAEPSLRSAAHPDPATLLLAATGPRRRLWERRPLDPDWLHLRVGTGDLASEIEVFDPELEFPRGWTAPDVPVVVDLAAVGVLGVCGDPEERHAVAASLLGQLAVLHAPGDLQIRMFARDARAGDWEWVRWLPQVRAAEDDAAFSRVGTDEATLRTQIDQLRRIIAVRSDALVGRGTFHEADQDPFPPIVVILEDMVRLRDLPGLESLLQLGPAVDVAFICLDDELGHLPAECRAVIRVADETLSVDTVDAPPVDGVRPDLVDRAWAELMARALAPLQEVAELPARNAAPAGRVEDRGRVAERGTEQGPGEQGPGEQGRARPADARERGPGYDDRELTGDPAGADATAGPRDHALGLRFGSDPPGAESGSGPSPSRESDAASEASGEGPSEQEPEPLAEAESEQPSAGEPDAATGDPAPAGEPAEESPEPLDVAGVPERSRLLDLLHSHPTQFAQGWALSPRTSEAILGESAEGALTMDLAAGPHVLIGAEDAAQRAALLRTVIASLAVRNRPDALVFALVEDGGGNAFEVCLRLPHTVSTLTRLEPRGVRRALYSLAAEMRRREDLLNAHEVEDLAGIPERDELDALGRGRPARLVIVIHDVAALLAAWPEAHPELLAIARRGGALGMHLVMGAAEPERLDPALLEAAALRAGLRLDREASSRALLGSPDAARLDADREGLGILRVGAAALVIFQTAGVGDPTEIDEDSGVRLVPLRWDSIAAGRSNRPDAGVEDGVRTDLTVLASHLSEAARRSGVRRDRAPWLPPLPPTISVEDARAASSGEALAADLRVPIGFADHPHQQSRPLLTYDLEPASHVLIASTAGRGRTSVLRLVAAMVTRHMPIEDVHVHAIDFGGDGLATIADLPHVGTVVEAGEPERLRLFTTRIRHEIARRRAQLDAGGHTGLRELRASVPRDERLPYLVVLIDRWDFLVAIDRARSGGLVAEWEQITRDAARVGLRLVVTAGVEELSGPMGPLLDDAFLLGGDALGPEIRVVEDGDADDLPPGRALRVGTLEEVQFAVLGAEADRPDQVGALRHIARAAQLASAHVPAARRPFTLAPVPGERDGA